MIENPNKSKNPSNVEFFDIKKFIGVASVNVLAVNPDNEKLRQLGWSVPADAAEPDYLVIKERNGKEVQSRKIRLVVQIQELDSKPVVAMDFFIRPDIQLDKEGKKCKVIDSYGRTAWATKPELINHAVPQYKNGPAQISSNYNPCHFGEEELATFTMKYLNITPLQIFDKKGNTWVASKNPGKLTFDDWKALCAGDTTELKRYLATQPSNRVKVVFGVVTTAENKTYQTFLMGTYIGNGALPDKNTGEYLTARKAIDKFMGDLNENITSTYNFSAAPVREWAETASEVTDNSAGSFTGTPGYAIEDSGYQIEDKGDLPF